MDREPKPCLRNQYRKYLKLQIDGLQREYTVNREKRWPLSHPKLTSPNLDSQKTAPELTAITSNRESQHNRTTILEQSIINYVEFKHVLLPYLARSFCSSSKHFVTCSVRMMTLDESPETLMLTTRCFTCTMKHQPTLGKR